MRILALKAKGYVLPAIHASMVRAFQSCGVEVFDLPVPQDPLQYQTLKEISKNGYDAIFALDLGVNPGFISNLKELQLSVRISWIIWFVDDPDGYGFPEVCDPDWTLTFCWDEAITHREFSWGGRPLVHLPLATDPSVFWPERADSGLLYPGGVFVGSTAHPNDILSGVPRNAPGFWEDVEAVWLDYREDFRQPLHSLAWRNLAQKTKHDLYTIQTDQLCRLWIQSLVYHVGMIKRREVVSKVIKPGGGIFGDEGWSSVLKENLYQGRIEYGNELRRVYSNSTFVLDVRQPQSRTGLSQRIFDAGVCGCPVLGEWSPEFEVLFEPEDEIFSFRSLAEALEMGERYSQGPKDVQRKGEKVRQRVLAHHTYGHRTAEILKAFHKLF
ncbi:MAG: glycosyltransferase [Pseudomonadota bacterium]